MSQMGKVDFVTREVASDTEFDANVVVANDTSVDNGVTNADDGSNQVEPIGIAYNGTKDGETQGVTVAEFNSSLEPMLKFSAAVSRGAEVSFSIVSATRGQGTAAVAGNYVIGRTKKAMAAGEIGAIDVFKTPYVKA